MHLINPDDDMDPLRFRLLPHDQYTNLRMPRRIHAAAAYHAAVTVTAASLYAWCCKLHLSPAGSQVCMLLISASIIDDAVSSLMQCGRLHSGSTGLTLYWTPGCISRLAACRCLCKVDQSRQGNKGGHHPPLLHTQQTGRSQAGTTAWYLPLPL